MANVIKSMIGDILHYTKTDTNIAGRMRNWEPVYTSEVINCNRPDLWEAFEESGKAKRIKAKNALGIALGLFTIGAMAFKAINDSKFNTIT